MDSDKPNGYGYQIGPGPELLQQIGQIIVNYSECERAIFEIFKSVMALTAEDGHLLVKAANVNPEKMIAIILKRTDRIRPALLVDPLLESLTLFKSSIEFRNEVAHWQWAVTDGTTGFASNSIKAPPGTERAGKNFELSELKQRAWRLAKAAALLNQVGICMFAPPKIRISGSAWEPGYYSNRGPLDEFMLSIALAKIQQTLNQVEASFGGSEPGPSSDTTPR